MTVLVAVKFKDGVVLGADRRCSGSYSKIKGGVQKILPMKYSNSAIAFCGECADFTAIKKRGELVNYKDILDNVDINHDYVQNTISKIIYDAQVSNHRIDPSQYSAMGRSSYIFITGERIFTIENDFFVIEHSNYATKGCGQDCAEGFLETELDSLNSEDLSEEAAVQIVTTAIEKACTNQLFVGEGYMTCVLKKG